MRTDAKMGLLSVILLGPALILVTTSFLGVEGSMPSALFHPVPLLGGLLAALGLSAFRVLRVRFAQEPDAVVGTVSLRLRGTGLPLSTLLLSLLLFGIITVYLFLENFQPRVIE